MTSDNPPDVNGLAERLVVALNGIGVRAKITRPGNGWAGVGGIYGDGDGYEFSVVAETTQYVYRHRYNGKSRIKYLRAEGENYATVQRPQPKAGFDLAAIAADMKETLVGLDAARSRRREATRKAQEASKEILRLLGGLPPGRDGVEVVIRGADVSELTLIVKPLTVAHLERLLAAREFLDAIGAE